MVIMNGIGNRLATTVLLIGAVAGVPFAGVLSLANADGAGITASQLAAEDALADRIERAARKNVALSALLCRQGSVEIRGLAQTNAAVARFMEALTKDLPDLPPDLDHIKADPSHKKYNLGFVIWLRPKQNTRQDVPVLCRLLNRTYARPPGD